MTKKSSTASAERPSRPWSGRTTKPSPCAAWASILYYDQVIDGRSPPLLAWGGILLFATFWNGILSIFWNGAYLVPWRQRRLYRNGRVGFGVIRNKSATSGKNRSYTLEYDFFTEDGQTGTGKIQVRDFKEYEAATLNENVIVLHRDGRVKPSVLYKYGMYRCVE